MRSSLVIAILFIATVFVPALWSPVFGQVPAQGTGQPAMAATSTEFEAAMKLYRQRRYAQAIEAFDAVIQSEPNNAAAHYFKGYAQYVTGQHEQSVASFSQAFQADPVFDPRPYFRAR